MQELEVQDTNIKLVLLPPKENKIPSKEEIKTEVAKFIFLLIGDN